MRRLFRCIKNEKLLKLLKELPQAAALQYTHKSMIGEIIGTNDIENIHSTRKEVREIVVDPSKTKTRRLRSIARRYIMLIDSDCHISLDNCDDIREIYNELLYEEIESEDRSNLPDGVFFRKSPVTVNSSTDKVLHRGVYPESKIEDYRLNIQ